TLDGEVDDDQAVLGELAAVAENDVGGVLQTEAVDVDVAGGHAALQHAEALAVDLDHLSVVDGGDVLGEHARGDRQLAVRGEMPVLAVHRHEVSRPAEGEQEAQLLARGVAGGVEAVRAATVGVGAQPVQVVDGEVHRLLVAGDGIGAQHHGVAGMEGDEWVLAARDAAERGERLPPGTGPPDVRRPNRAPCRREMWEAKVATSPRPAAPPISEASAGATDRSLGVIPSDSALVLSLSRRRTPASPRRARRARSGGSPWTGDWSTLKSPVWMITPRGVWRAS